MPSGVSDAEYDALAVIDMERVSDADTDGEAVAEEDCDAADVSEMEGVMLHD